MYKIVNGIQHIGIGVKDHNESWPWYRKYFGMDIPFFDSVAEAPLMKHYNRDTVIEKRAAMVFNIKGGCAAEVIQATSFEPQFPNFEVKMGDIGIFVTKIKTDKIAQAHEQFVKDQIPVSEIASTPNGSKTFFVKDPNNLTFQLVEHNQWFTKSKAITGGIYGCTIGVTDMDKSIKFYSEQMGFDEVVYDESGSFDDLQGFVDGGENTFRRVLLVQKQGPMGNWREMTGSTQLELIQVLDREPQKIFKGRQWADIGFVHMGMDVKGMAELEKDMAKAGHPFTCDSTNELDMGKTRVHCVYIEDPDNTLIELIEVYKVPLVEKWGLFMDVEKRHPKKALPKFMMKLMRFSRVK